MLSGVQAATAEVEKKAWLKQQQAEQKRWQQEEQTQREEKKKAILKLKVLHWHAGLLAALAACQACCGDKQKPHAPKLLPIGTAFLAQQQSMSLQHLVCRTLGPAQVSTGHLLMPMFFAIIHKDAHSHPLGAS